jgi:hypothetical protein
LRAAYLAAILAAALTLLGGCTKRIDCGRVFDEFESRRSEQADVSTRDLFFNRPHFVSACTDLSDNQIQTLRRCVENGELSSSPSDPTCASVMKALEAEWARSAIP